jgi:4'-phosphopantetheinyl transferase
MIHWRFGGWHDAGLPDREQAWDWLCAEERERVASFKVAKRADDWLIGRLNAKALLVDALDYRYGVRMAPHDLHVARQPSGAPRVVLAAGAAGRGLPDPLPLCLSNSHSHAHALCAVLWTDGYETTRSLRAVGVDVEWVEPRSEGFVADFLTEPERAFCRAVEGRARHLRANMVWSAKESVLKVVQRGLTIDTWWLTCVPAPDPEAHWLPPLLTPVDGEWDPLAVACDPRFPTHGLTFHGAWREIGGFVATLAVGEQG